MAPADRHGADPAAGRRRPGHEPLPAAARHVSHRRRRAAPADETPGRAVPARRGVKESRPVPARDGRRKILLISASHHQPDGSVARVERYWTSGLTLAHLEALTPPDFVCELVDDFMDAPPL